MTISKYYNFATLLSYNATFNGVCGGRGMGKTFGSKKKGINDALRTSSFGSKMVETEKRGKSVSVEVHESLKVPHQFIYLRRYKEELALAKATFFADIEYLWPNWDFRIQGWEAQASPTKYAEVKNRPWATIGYFIALSVGQNYKSVQFPNVKTIIYDEFIVERGAQYLPEEAMKFVNFYNTVDRYKDKTRVLMLSNAVTISNPYFIQYQVEPQKADEKGLIRMADGYMIWHFPESKEFESEVYKTKFGKFIADTDPSYADYAVGNKFRDAHDALIAKKTKNAEYLFTLETAHGVFSVWIDFITAMYYAQTKRPSADEDYVTLVPEKMSEGKRLAKTTDKTIARLRSAFNHDRMRFERPATRSAFMEVFKR